VKRGFYMLFAGLGFALVLGTAWVYTELGRQTPAAPTLTSVVTDVTPAAGAGEPAAGGTTLAPRPDAADPAAGAGVPSAPSAYLAQDEGQGSVSVSAALLTTGSPAEDASVAMLAGQVGANELGIAVWFVTHSVDLSGLDLAALSILRTPKGDVAPLRWVSEDDSAHHRSGMLVFPSEDVNLNASGDLALIMKDIAGIPERAMTWHLPQS